MRTRLGDDHALGVHHQPDAGGATVRQDLLDPVQAVVETTTGPEHLVAGHRDVGDPRQHRADHAVEPTAGREDPLHVPRQDVGQAQQADGLGRGRAVDHQGVPVARLGEGLDVAEGEDLVEPGHDGQLLGLDGVDAGPVEHVDEPALDLVPGLLHAGLGVELEAAQALGDRCGGVPQLDAEAVGQRVGRIGRQHQGAVPGVGAGQRGGGGHRGLAHAALAGEQQDAQVGPAAPVRAVAGQRPSVTWAHPRGRPRRPPASCPPPGSSARTAPS